ncbi:CBD9-like protein [Penicillium daleae]|uniref:CBD9-like protein n=1 Tax=Penicillium daleae TaxID=63821 RepID=A0AAD6CG71_9EURO|nr:CBD9-like protein [Penicillium daleae]KAJ5464702.1 CBD9-like protein [Penicillium daleae]
MSENYATSPATASKPAPASSSSPASSYSEYSSAYVPVPALIAHGFLMTFAIGLFLPIGAMVMQVVPWQKKVSRIHAPLQAFALAMLVSGMGVGIYLGVSTSKIDYYHPIIGFIVVGGLLLFQPLMGLYSHLHLRKTGARSNFAYVHRWFGRIMVILGIINGGLGFMLAGVGSPGVPLGAVIAYSVIAGVVISAYLAVVVFGTAKQVAHPKP